MATKTVFISYSHDSDEHRDKVLSLSERLLQDGIKTVLDQYVSGSPEQGWPRWMLDQLDAADFVLVVCTETYYRRFRGHEEPGIGKGADWEGSIITQELYDSRSRTLKFVPIFLSDAVDDWIPDPLRSLTYYAVTSESGYTRLYDFLLGQSGVEPGQIGELKTRPRRTGTPLTFDNATAAREPGELVLSQDFIDDKVKQAALELDQARADKSLTMRKLVGALDRLFERSTFRWEPSVTLCVTQDWDYRLHAGLQTLRLMEAYEEFVENEAGEWLAHYRELTAEVSRYCQRMAAYLFKPAVGLAGLRVLVGTSEFIDQTHDKIVWFEGGVDPTTAERIDQHLGNAIRHMKTLYDEVVSGGNERAATPRETADSTTPSSTPIIAARSSAALATWKKKLAFLQDEEARTSDAEQKFSIQQRIEEAQSKIREFGGESE